MHRMDEESGAAETRVKVLLDILGIDETRVLNIYQYGSRVCGTSVPGVSDWDFMLVLEDGYDIPFERAMQNVDTNNYTRSLFIERIKEHDMSALTCLFLPPENVWKMSEDFSEQFVCSLDLLRGGVSTISHKAFGYANICDREGDPRRARKNLVHSVRYLLYGIQLAKHGRIVDYRVANNYYHELLGDGKDIAPLKGDWCVLRKKYKRLGKDLHREFEALLPAKQKGEGAVQRKKRRAMKRKEKMRRVDIPRGEEAEAYSEALLEACIRNDGIVHGDRGQARNLVMYYVCTAAIRPNQDGKKN